MATCLALQHALARRLASTYIHVTCMYAYPAQYSECVNCKKRSAESLLMMSLCAYFQKTSKSCLPNPRGPLSKQLPSSCIESANNHVEEVAKQTTTEGAKGRKRGPYIEYTPKDRAEVANYTTLHGTSAANRHIKARFPDLKWTTVNNWKEAMIKATTKAARDGQLEKIVEKKRG